MPELELGQAIAQAVGNAATKLVLSAPVKGGDVRRVTIERRGEVYQAETLTKTQAFHRMLRKEELQPFVEQMLGEKLEKYGTKVYLVNTGWAGGSAAAGAKRMKLSYTRAMVTAALNGSFDNIEFKHHDVFNVDYPTSCPEKLDARGMWADKAAYDEQANKLAAMFQENFAKKYPNMPADIVAAGPKAK